jgi:predicted RNA binding protein YcfA (HicA-like mRNA interferase family)
MLQSQKAEGTRVVVLMMPRERVELMFRVIKVLEQEGWITPGEFTWIMFRSEEIINYR